MNTLASTCEKTHVGVPKEMQGAARNDPDTEGQKNIEIVDLPVESKKELIEMIKRNATGGQANELAGLEPSRVTVFKDYVCYYTDIDLIEASEFFDVDEDGLEEAMISIREVLTRSMEKAPIQDLVKEAVLVGSEGYDAVSAKEFTEAIIPVSREEICEIQRKDPALCELAKKMKGGDRYGKFLLVRKMLYKVVIYDGKICSPVVLPRELVEKCVKQHHVMLCHPGIKKLYAFLKQRFYWPRMDQDIEKYTKSCQICKQVSMSPDVYDIKTTDIPTRPFQKIAIDLCGKWPTSSGGNVYIMTTMCLFSGWPEAYAIPDKTAETVGVKFENEYLTRHSFPIEVLSDNGSEFISHALAHILGKGAVKHITISVYSPSSNGKLERWHGYLKAGLKKLTYKDIFSWDLFINRVLFSYRILPGPTGYSPFFLCKGYEPKLAIDFLLSGPKYQGEEGEELKWFEQCRPLWEMARQDLKRYRSKTTVEDNSPSLYQVGDSVCVRIHDKSKLGLKWTAPQFKVLAAPSNRTVLLECSQTGKKIKLHVKHVKKCDPEDLWLGESHLRDIITDQPRIAFTSAQVQ